MDTNIDLAVECPFPISVQLDLHTDFHFLIGLIAIRNEKYRSHYQIHHPQGCYRVVDSGIFEDPKNPPTCTQLLNIAEQLGADEVVPVDFLNDYKATRDSMEEFLALSSDFPFKLQGVVQGKALDEWVECFWYMHDHPRVDVVGVSYCDVPEDIVNRETTQFGVDDISENARLLLLSLVNGGYTGKSLSGVVKKPIHILGLRTPKAIPILRQFPCIRSLDTSFPVQLGIEGRMLNMNSPKPTFKMNFTQSVDNATLSLISMNTHRLRQLCRGQADVSEWEIVQRTGRISN